VAGHRARYVPAVRAPCVVDARLPAALPFVGNVARCRRRCSRVAPFVTALRSGRPTVERRWTLAEQDLLDPATPYTLRDTGQGVHRVQECTRLRQAMRMLLHDQQLRAEAPAAAAAVSRSCACIGSPCLRHCGHGASIGGGRGLKGGSWRLRGWVGGVFCDPSGR
jgi:hypothetical protein